MVTKLASTLQQWPQTTFRPAARESRRDFPPITITITIGHAMRRSFIPGLIVCGIFLLTNAASQELGKIDATQPTGPLDATRREIDSISILNLIDNLELRKDLLERLAEIDLAKQDPAIMVKIIR